MHPATGIWESGVLGEVRAGRQSSSDARREAASCHSCIQQANGAPSDHHIALLPCCPQITILLSKQDH